MQDAITQADRGATLIGYSIKVHDLWGSDPTHVFGEMLADQRAAARADNVVETRRGPTSHIEGKSVVLVSTRC
ncbi:MAG: hypothetical protein AAFX05_13230 [Planctomycetota bacterium]